MTDQNTATIIVAIVGVLSTILGGVLAIIGNYVFVHKNIKHEKDKLIREKIEEMYEITIDLADTVNLARRIIRGEETREDIKSLKWKTSRFYMLICLYTPSIKVHAEIYISYLRLIEYYCVEKHVKDNSLKIDTKEVLKKEFSSFFIQQVIMHDLLANMLRYSFK